MVRRAAGAIWEIMFSIMTADYRQAIRYGNRPTMQNSMRHTLCDQRATLEFFMLADPVM